MSKMFSDDKSMFATFGKAKDGTYSATLHMAAHGDEYPSFGIHKAEAFESRQRAEAWAYLAMNAEEDEVTP